MPRAPRDARIETREARKRLRIHHEPYWRQIHQGLFVGYRKGRRGGAWYLKAMVDGKRSVQRIASADDHADSDGDQVLSYREAVAKVVDPETVRRVTLSSYTVADCLKDYLAHFEARAKSLHETELAAHRWIVPEEHPKKAEQYAKAAGANNLGPRKVAELTTDQLRRWHRFVAKTDSTDPDAKRARRARANRVLTVLKAALNQAWQEGKADQPERWQRVKPFPNVQAPRARFLTAKESQRLVNKCGSPFRELVRAALLTGCRYGELTAMRVGDYDPESETVAVTNSKSGKARHVPLTGEGAELFDELTAGRGRDELLLIRRDGEAWSKNDQVRPMREASTAAKLDPPATFHDLRRTYGALLAREGVSLMVIARAMGHADTRMTELHYAHLQPDHVANEVRAHLPRFDKRRGKVRRVG